MMRLIGQLVWKGAGKHFLARDFCRITGHFSDGQSPCDWWMRLSCLNSRWAPDTEGLGYRIAAWSRLTFVPLASPKDRWCSLLIEEPHRVSLLSILDHTIIIKRVCINWFEAMHWLWHLCQKPACIWTFYPEGTGSDWHATVENRVNTVGGVSL